MKTYIKTTLTILISGMLFSSCEDQLNQANTKQQKILFGKMKPISIWP